MRAYTDAQLDALSRGLDALATTHCGSSYEELLRMQAALAQRDANQQSHPAVRSCLLGMALALEKAAFDFYASYK